MEKLAEAVWLKFVSRIAMIVATFIILPIGTMIGNRMIAASDHTTAQLIETEKTIAIMAQRLDDRRLQRDAQLNNLQGTISDHETRLRTLERVR